MRTTVTLDPDTKALIDRAMRERGLSFKEAVNTAIRQGLSLPQPSRRQSTPTYRMGLRPELNLDKALRLSGELEDAEILRKMARRK